MALFLYNKRSSLRKKPYCICIFYSLVVIHFFLLNEKNKCGYGKSEVIYMKEKEKFALGLLNEILFANGVIDEKMKNEIATEIWNKKAVVN